MKRAIRYVHTNIVTHDWRRLARFYRDALGCEILEPDLDIGGDWLSEGTGVEDAALTGVHLRFPGHGETGPTLELFEYRTQLEPAKPPAANRGGLRHMAFEVDDVEAVRAACIEHGGADLGQPVVHPLKGHGTITFTYLTDPDGNIIELQSWSEVSRYGPVDRV